MVAHENVFTPNKLLEYAESLVKWSRIQESRVQESNYGWLRARTICNSQIYGELHNFMPEIQKLTAESCTAIAVKLDSLSDAPADVIKRSFQKLLEEQNSIQLMVRNVKRAKESKQFGSKLNKVHPILLPPGREATVSFILD